MTTQKPQEKASGLSGIAAGIGEARTGADHLSKAAIGSGRAYVAGVVALGRALGGIGRETVTEFGQHAKATFAARSLRDLAELQAGWAQNRIETATAQAKDLADLAREKTEDTIAPFAALLKKDRSA